MRPINNYFYDAKIAEMFCTSCKNNHLKNLIAISLNLFIVHATIICKPIEGDSSKNMPFRPHYYYKFWDATTVMHYTLLHAPHLNCGHFTK